MRFCQLNASTISSFLESIEFITSQISIWGATLTFFFYTYDEPISIRAPRKGAAGLPRPGPAHPGYFNPRSPYGERRIIGGGWTLMSIFQSTLPIRGATLSEGS